MRSYWMKIGLGAIGVFVVAYGVVLVGRRLVRNVVSDGVSIPVGRLAFTVDGLGRLGTMRRIAVRRAGPDRGHETLEVLVTADAWDSLGALSGCGLTPRESAQLGGDGFFTCLRGDSARAGFTEFGIVRLTAADGGGAKELVVPLLLPESEAGQLRVKTAHGIRVDLHRRAAQAEASRIRAEARALAESVEAAVPPPTP